MGPLYWIYCFLAGVATFIYFPDLWHYEDSGLGAETEDGAQKAEWVLSGAS